MDDIQKRLWELQDQKYREFQISLIPTIDPASVIGVRTPALRKLAKELLGSAEAETFLTKLPHTYFEENQLHAFLLSEEKDYVRVINELQRFLPYIDNWATCDQLRPKLFKKHRTGLLSEIRRWIVSDRPYTVRFAIGMLLVHYLDEDYDPEYLRMVCAVKRDEYYVNMMIAWYLATALAKQYEDAVCILESEQLGPFVQNKTIQKACESFRVSKEQKEYLKTWKRKKI